MKKIILSLICLNCFVAAYSQSITYQKTFNDALTQAAATHKPIFITIEPTTAKPKNDYSGLEAPDAETFYNQNFINFSVNYADTAAQALIDQYKTQLYPAYVFVDWQAHLLFRGYGRNTSSGFFIKMGQKALDAQASGRTITNYELRYGLGTRDSAFLKDYINLREELGFYDNAKLADDYVALLQPNDLNNYNEVLFILEAGPYAYGRAYEFCWSDNKTADSIYHHEPSLLRIAINNRISDNTINFAIKNKRLDIAQSAARFSASTWSENQRRAGMSNASHMLQYYWGVKDTASYLSLAAFYYNEYYMSISTDSVRKTVPNTNSINNSISKTATLTPKNITTPTDSIGPNPVASTLNDAAYKFYTSGTQNQTYLSKAMLWVVHSIELYPDCHNFDTLAHLLYRLGYFADAEANETHAIEFAKRADMSNALIDKYTVELDKIKNKKL